MSDAFNFVRGSVKKAMAGCSSADLWKVPPARLRIKEGFNVRVRNKAYEQRVRRIADSIKANGYYSDKPLAGYPALEDGEHVIYVTDGHTRHEALMLAISEGAEIAAVPVVPKPEGTSLEDLTVALVTSNAGEPLSPFEVAVVCKRLIDYGVEEDEIAQRLGYTKTYVGGLLLLMSAPRAIRKLVESGRVSAALAVDVLKKHGSKAEEVLKAAAEQAGKDKGVEDAKVTPKAVARSQSGGQRVIRAPKSVLKSAVSYLREEKLLEDERFMKFLMLLAGAKDAAELAPFLAEKKPAEPTKAAKVTKTAKVDAQAKSNQDLFDTKKKAST